MTPDPKTVSARLRRNAQLTSREFSFDATSELCEEAADLIDAQDAELGRLKGFVAHQDEEIEALQIAHTAQHARATAAESSLARLQAVYEAAKGFYIADVTDRGVHTDLRIALRTALTAYEKGDAAA